MLIIFLWRTLQTARRRKKKLRAIHSPQNIITSSARSPMRWLRQPLQGQKMSNITFVSCPLFLPSTNQYHKAEWLISSLNNKPNPHNRTSRIMLITPQCIIVIPQCLPWTWPFYFTGHLLCLLGNGITSQKISSTKWDSIRSLHPRGRAVAEYGQL